MDVAPHPIEECRQPKNSSNYLSFVISEHKYERLCISLRIDLAKFLTSKSDLEGPIISRVVVDVVWRFEDL
jgi:hypothetical protein